MVKDAASCVTLRRVAGFAAWLARIRPLIMVLTGVSAAWFLYEIGWAEASGARSLLALSGLLWTGIALGIGYTLPVAPRAVGVGDSFRLRLRKRLLQVAYGIVLALTVALVLVASGLTARAVSIGMTPGRESPPSLGIRN